MKHKFWFGIIFAGIFFTGCASRTEKEPESALNKCTRYACPVHLDKTSATLIKCPECNTLMVALPDSLKKDSVKH